MRLRGAGPASYVGGSDNEAHVDRQAALALVVDNERIDVELGSLREVDHQLRHAQKGIDQRLPIRRRLSSYTVDQRPGADLAEHLLGLPAAEGGDAERDVLQRLDVDAAEPKGDERTKLWVAGHPDEHLEPRRGHLLHLASPEPRLRQVEIGRA